MGYLYTEKCELREARNLFEGALSLAKKEADPFHMSEALVGLLRLAGEALDDVAVEHWNKEIDLLAEKYPNEITPRVDYCRGVILMFHAEWLPAQRQMHAYLRKVKFSSQVRNPNPNTQETDYFLVRALCMLANCLLQRGHTTRAQKLLNLILRQYEKKKLRSINGIAYLIQGTLFEHQKNYAAAYEWFQKANAAFLEEHNWYFYLYVLYGYARLARQQENYKQAFFYLELVEKAAHSKEFGVLRREIGIEKYKIENEVIDLLIDASRGVVKTRDGGTVSFRKQYVLMDILQALSKAHLNLVTGPMETSGATENPMSGTSGGGLSKGQLIEQVWNEDYRPEVHDNKLYYNINRLRKLLEPNMRRPQYLLNWKEGYRLAPGLRIQFVDLANEEASDAL